MEEVWKPVVGYEDLYEVSNLGNVRGRRGVLNPQPRRHGYLSVWLYGNGGSAKRDGKQFSVHRLVAEAFIPNPNGCDEVNHKDECKTNNCVDNLEWLSHRDNTLYGTGIQRRVKKQTNGKRSKPIAQYTLGGELLAIFPSLHEASRSGFDASNICNCAKGHPRYSSAYGYIWRYVSE